MKYERSSRPRRAGSVVRSVQRLLLALVLGPVVSSLPVRLIRDGDVSELGTKVWDRLIRILYKISPDLMHWVRDLVHKLFSHRYIVGTCAIIRSTEGKYLLVHHRYPIGDPGEEWGLPGGSVNKQGLDKALRRELEQELQIRVEDLKLVAVDESEAPRLDFFFECKISEVYHPDPRGEVTEVDYFSLDSLPDGMGIYKRHLAVLEQVDATIRKRGGQYKLLHFPASKSPLDKGNVIVYNGRNMPEREIEPAIPAKPELPHRTIYFDLGRLLEDLPKPGTCSFCDGALQKEYLDYRRSTSSLDVVCLSPVPAFGCTNCGVKEWDTQIAIDLYKAAAEAVRQVGFDVEANYFKDEVGWLQRSEIRSTEPSREM